ncbi:hypothetical protein HYU96_04520 [Candidatus Daviesbacteria bacterium]|nr:hypothetical protein [Candidatus Daviesbacteria bacterium]
MRLKIAQVIGLNTDQQAAQVVSQIQDAENAFLALLRLSCDDAFTKGRQALSDLSDFYFDFEGSPAQKLTAAFAEGVKKFSGEGEYDLCLAAVSGKVLYLTGQGRVEVYLKREDKLSPLLSTGSAGALISGFLEEGDKLMLASKSLSDLLGEDLSKSMDLPKDAWEEEMSSKVARAESGEGGLAGLFARIDQQDQEDQKEEESVISLPGLQEKEIIPPRARAILAKLLGFFPKSGRGRLILAVVLIIIIALGTGYQYKLGRDRERNLQFDQALQAAKDDFNAAKGLSSLNPAEAKIKLDTAKDKIGQALVLKPKDSGARDLKNQIEQESSSILQQAQVADFPLFLDLDLVKKDFKAYALSFSAGKILVLDRTQYSLAAIDAAKKSNQILAGKSQLGEAQLSSLNGNLAFSYSADKGLVRTDLTNQKQTQVAKVDEEWGNIADMSGFAGNVYLLDSTKNQVWKYLPTSEGYSGKRDYLTQNTKADFTGSLRMQIESSIYVLKQGGEILRFTRGEKDNFSYSGLPSPVKDPKSFFVSSDTDDLYLLDSGNARLLVLTKTGAYKAQYQSERFREFSDLVVDEKAKKVYLLEGSKIYTMDLK